MKKIQVIENENSVLHSGKKGKRLPSFKRLTQEKFQHKAVVNFG